MRLSALALVFAALSSGQAPSRPSGMLVRIGPACELRNVRTSVSESVAEGGWAHASGITTFQYLIRTSRLTGGGEIRLEFPTLPAAELSWSADAGFAGQAVQTDSAVRASVAEVIRFGAGSRSANAGETGTVRWNVRWPAGPGGASTAAISAVITCR